MSPKKSGPLVLSVAVLGVFFLSLTAAIVIKAAIESRTELPYYGRIPSFELTEKSGETFTDESMIGSMWVVDFIFTNCQGACPTMSGHMADLYQYYSHSNKLRFLSFSVDPERDTLEILRTYAKRQGVTDDRWLFLRGSIDEIIRISEEGFMLAAENLPMGHSTKYVLVDWDGQIRGYYEALNESSIELMKTHIRALGKDVK